MNDSNNPSSGVILVNSVTESSLDSSEPLYERVYLSQLSHPEFKEFLQYSMEEEGYTEQDMQVFRVGRAYEQLLLSKNLLTLADSMWRKLDQENKGAVDWLNVLIKTAKDHECDNCATFFKEDFETWEMMQDISNARENEFPELFDRDLKREEKEKEEKEKKDKDEKEKDNVDEKEESEQSRMLSKPNDPPVETVEAQLDTMDVDPMSSYF